MSRRRGFGLQAAVLCCVFGMLCGVSLEARANVYSLEDASQIVTDTVLGGSTDGIRLFQYPEPIDAGTTISTYKRDVFDAPAEGWFLFIDLFPRANWEHACQYVFVDAATGAVETHNATVPPALQLDMEELTNGRDNPTPEESARMHEWFDRRMEQVQKPNRQDRGQAYAFIISGGASAGNNHIRYWNDCSFIYKVLVNYYGYADDHIYVCISDGLDPGIDRSDNTNSPPDLDGDGDDDIQYPATYNYIEQVFGELATILSPSDQLFIYTTDHGGQQSGWDAYLNLWNWEELHDDQLASMVNALPCQTIIGTFEQCFSGGMIDDLEAEGRVLSSAASYNEYSWAMGPNYIYDEYVYYWTSAVGWADPYGNPVDADTNDDGIVSMHEAFIYAEAHDTADETPQYSSTPADLGEMLNLMGNLEGVYLAVENYVIDDDPLGASHGNGNGVIEFGETIELTVAMNNMGSDDAAGVTGTLDLTSGCIGMMVGEATFGDIPAGGTVANAEPFVFHVGYHVPDLEDLGCTIAVSEEPLSLALPLVARAPAYQVSITNVDDTVGGDGDGLPEPGEDVDLTIRVTNTGGCPTPDLTADLSSGSGYFVPDETPQAIGVLDIGVGVDAGPFSVAITPDCPEVYAHFLRIHLRGSELYQSMVPMVFSVGQVFADDIESGGAAWTHYAGPGSWTDEWHLETYRNHTAGGTSSWKCGGAGAVDYGNLVYGCLETADLNLPADAQLTFWHWMDAEISSYYPEYCYDGGLLEISTDGGQSWSGLTPSGGYPYLIRAGGTPGPFAEETPVWSGTFGWTEVSVSLADYSGAARLRWAFGSDGGVTGEGWYVDDVRIEIGPPSQGIDDGAPGVVLRPTLFPVRPNPVMASASVAGMSIRFAMPRAENGQLTVHDATGRMVRMLAQGRFEPGENQITWNGQDNGGSPVPAGTYYFRLGIGDKVSTQRVTMIR